MNNNKVVIFVSSSKNLRGGDFSMLSVIKKFQEKNIRSIIIVPCKCKSTEFFKEQGIDYICIPFKLWLSSSNSYIIKHVHNIIKKIYNKILIKKNYKEFLKIKNKNDIICIYNNGFTNNFSFYLAKKLNVPHVQHIREFGVEDFNWIFELGKNKQFEEVEKNSQVIIAISNAVKQSFSKAKNYEKIKVIYNGVKEVELDVQRRNNHEDIVKLVISGGLLKCKGHMELLQAILKIKERGIYNFKLDIYGEGEEKINIENFIKSNGLEKFIELKGFVLDINYQNYDVGIMTSNAEAFGRVTVEYMMNGLAVIASNSGANKEIIVDNENGMLYQKGDIEDLSKKLINIIKKENDRKRISKEARKTALNKFSEEVYTDNIYNLLKKEKIIY